MSRPRPAPASPSRGFFGILPLAVTLLVGPAVSAGLAQPRRAPDRPEPTRPLVRQISFEQEVLCQSATGKGWLAEVEVRIPLPKSDRRQRISGFTLSPEPTRRTRDAWGNEIAVYRRSRITAGQPLRLGWRCRAELLPAKHEVDRRTLGALDEVPAEIRARYLADGAKYRLDDTEFRSLALSAAQRPKDVYDLAWQLNEFVRKRLTYLNDGYWEAAPRVYRNGHGSCSEYNFLFVALCRAHGLPARYVGASALRGDSPVYEDTIHHRWSEVYLPGHGWFPVDVSRNDGEDGRPINQSFGQTEAGLLVLMKGDGSAEAPLAWSYVSAISSRAMGDARLVRPKRFLWRAAGGNDAEGN